MKGLKDWKGPEGEKVGVARVLISVVHMVPTLGFGGRAQGTIVHGAKRTEKPTISITGQEILGREPGKFLQASAQRILSRDRQNAGSDRLRPI